MTHDVTVSAAECGKCNGDIAQWTTREKESWVHMVHFEHLKAQKDALWEAFCEWLGPEPIAAVMKIELIPEITLVHFENLKQALLRAQREAKK